jgi:hypothetical protein
MKRRERPAASVAVIRIGSAATGAERPAGSGESKSALCEPVRRVGLPRFAKVNQWLQKKVDG